MGRPAEALDEEADAKLRGLVVQAMAQGLQPDPRVMQGGDRPDLVDVSTRQRRRRLVTTSPASASGSASMPK